MKPRCRRERERRTYAEPWRSLDEADDAVRETRRGTPVLTDQDEDDRAFGGPGTQVVSVDGMAGLGRTEAPVWVDDLL